MAVDEVRNLCIKQYGGGIQFKMHGKTFSHLFKFYDILKYSETLFFYVLSSIMQRMIHLKKAMRNEKGEMIFNRHSGL